MPHKLQCYLLCEDREHEQLFRPLLEQKFGRHRIRVEPRRGKEGGFTFVLARLEIAVKVLRHRRDEAVALLVVVDADDDGFRRRYDGVLAAVRQAGLDSASLERVAICIPARNVETWGLWLHGARDLDEQTDFKARFRSEVKPHLRPRQLAEAWLKDLSEKQRQEEESVLPALSRGRAEVKRLQELAAR